MVEIVHLTCSQFCVDLRLRQVAGVWLASADGPNGPTLGWGTEPMFAAIGAVQPFGEMAGELLARPRTKGPQEPR